MKRSERVLYLTLIDLLLQLLFLGLVLWVVFGLGYKDPARLDCNPAIQQRIDCGRNAEHILRRIAQFLDDNRIAKNDAAEKVNQALDLIDTLGSLEKASEILQQLADVMDDYDFSNRYQAFIDKAKTLLAAEQAHVKNQAVIDSFGGSGMAAEVAAKLSEKLGAEDSVEDFVRALDALEHIDAVKALKLARAIEQAGQIDQAAQQVNENEIANAVQLARILARHQITDASNLQALLAAYNEQQAGRNDQKPYIEIKDDRDNPHLTFKTGQAELQEGLIDKIDREAIPFIKGAVTQYHVNLIQVIGHTDEQPTHCYKTNSSRCLGKMDNELIGRLNSAKTDTSQIQGSNVDLGMLRAVEVVKYLKRRLASEGLTALYFQPLSAGQAILADGSLAQSYSGNDEAGRRRIEIRVTQK